MARKKFSAEFKVNVALEFLKEELTIAELAHKYDVHPTQIKEWKATLKTQAKMLFSQKNKEEDSNKGYVEALERKAGQLAMEIDFLKKNLTKYHQKND